MRVLLSVLLLIGMAGCVDLPTGGNPGLPALSFPLISASTGQPYPLGMRPSGAISLFGSYEAAGLSPQYAASGEHVWVVVPDSTGKYQAVDNYFGPVSDSSYYTADNLYSDTPSLRAAYPNGSAF